jgi:hypothetical protein
MIGLAFGLTCTLCSINSLGTPGMSTGFHAKDVPIFLEEFGEREFLFGVQITSYVSNLRGLLCG